MPACAGDRKHLDASLGKNMTPTLTRRFLAGLIVLSFFLMSLGVDTCQASCLFDGFSGLGESAPPSHIVHAAAAGQYAHFVSAHAIESIRTAMPLGMSVRSSYSMPGNGEEFCEDATTSVMVPAPRTHLQPVQWIATPVALPPIASNSQRVVETTPPLPSAAISPHLLSMTLRI